MPSVSRAQAALMAAADRDPALAQRRGIPRRVAHEFHRADSGILRRAIGGRARAATPLMMDFKSHLTYGVSPAQSFYATTPATGQAMSPVKRADSKIARADRDLARLRSSQMYAEGGKVAIASSAMKTIKDAISKLTDRERDLAIQTLRESRNEITDGVPAASGPATRTLQAFVTQPATPAVPAVAMANGGNVSSSDLGNADPAQLYRFYVQLLDRLEAPDTSGVQQADILQQLGKIEDALKAVGIQLEQDDEATEQSDATGMANGGSASMRPIERASVLDRILGTYGDLLSWGGEKARSVSDAMHPVTGSGMLMAHALKDTAASLRDSGAAFQDWSHGFSPIHSTGEPTQPVVNPEQLAAILSGLPPAIETARAIPGAVKSAAKDFAAASIDSMPRIVRKLPEWNYHTDLKTYAPRLYRETNGDGALEMMGDVHTDMTPQEVHFADTPEMALGQGRNKGIVLEFDSTGVEGRINLRKPGLAPAFENGAGEYIAHLNPQKRYIDNLRAITLKPDFATDKISAIRLKRKLAEYEKAGWTKSVDEDGTVTYRAPRETGGATE